MCPNNPEFVSLSLPAVFRKTHPSEASMHFDNGDRVAVEILMADADRTLALTNFDDSTGDRGAAQKTIASVHKSYIELRRRSGPLTMSESDQIAFLTKMDQLRACLKFFGQIV
jgi:hypothetical protein